MRRGDPLHVEVDIVPTEHSPRFDVGDLPPLVRFVLDRVGERGEWSIAVVLTSDEHVRRLHRDFMGLDTETDVMTFPAVPAPGSSAQGGDIVVAVGRAAVQAVEAGHDVGDEIRFLVVHGVLHLAGWTDATDEQRAAMLARQGELIAEFKARRRGGEGARRPGGQVVRWLRPPC